MDKSLFGRQAFFGVELQATLNESLQQPNQACIFGRGRRWQRRVGNPTGRVACDSGARCETCHTGNCRRGGCTRGGSGRSGRIGGIARNAEKEVVHGALWTVRWEDDRLAHRLHILGTNESQPAS